MTLTDWLLIGVILVLTLWMLWTHRRLAALERSAKGFEAGNWLRSRRLDVHSVHIGLLTKEQTDKVYTEMPTMDTQDWDKQSLELERSAVEVKGEVTPTLLH